MGLITSKLPLNKNMIEIKSEPEFFTEIKNCIDSLNKGVFIHYDYAEEEKQETENDEEEEEEDILEKSSEKYSVEQDLETLKELEQNLDKFKEGEINEEELQLTKIKIDRIMMKYNKMKDNKIEKAEEAQDEEYIDEENQNSMVRAYVNEKLDETVSNDIENNAFDEYLIESVKRLNILKLFTMEAKVDVIVAAVL